MVNGLMFQMIFPLSDILSFMPINMVRLSKELKSGEVVSLSEGLSL